MAAIRAAIGAAAATLRLAPQRVRSARRATSAAAHKGRRRLTHASSADDDGGSGSAGPRMKVAVTGAGGRTGGLVVKLLSKRQDAFAPPRGLVRSSKSADKVKALVGDAAGAVEVVQGDISDPAALAKLVDGPVDALVILTSAVPKPKILSLVQALVSKVLPWMENRRPEFYFPDDGTPEKVDWLWQKTQIDAALAAAEWGGEESGEKRASLSTGVKKIVLVSSMGGTQLDNFLNTMGGGGTAGQANILLWKRKAEMYLVASGADYTVVHPGGLLNTDGGKRELLVGMDDELLKGDRRSVPRADVAEMVVRCLEAPNARNLSFDLASREEGEGAGPTEDVVGLLRTLEVSGRRRR